MSEYRPGTGRVDADEASVDDRPGARFQQTRPSVPGLLRELVEDAALLATKELELAKAEIGQSITRAKAGVVSLAMGGAVLFAGFQLVLVALAIYLARYLPVWGAFALVGAVVLVVGLILVTAGRKRMDAEAFAPARTMQSMQRDQAMVREKLS